MQGGPTYKAEEDGAWGLPVPNTAPSPVHEAPLQSTGCKSVTYSPSILTQLAPQQLWAIVEYQMHILMV